eukprot:gb/GFBE01006610.1/.p1 GENE.gb/GFBE01006610.1/~~gb/GFBE01006610.1/.p1  ORF type:complete len:202 (+),score=20.16 gb/GFBE01006610.1/:1-606(+)
MSMTAMTTFAQEMPLSLAPPLRLRVLNTFIDVVDEEVVELARSRRSRSAPPRTCICRLTDQACAHGSCKLVPDSQMQKEPESSLRPQSPPYVPKEDPAEEQATYEHGIPPQDRRWAGMRKILIKNLPARCSHQELSDFIASFAGDMAWTLQLPLTNKRNRGFAFVSLTRSADALELAKCLWMSSIPTRQSDRILHVYPAED